MAFPVVGFPEGLVVCPVGIDSPILGATYKSVLFAGADGGFAQDNANFSYDDVAHTLSVVNMTMSALLTANNLVANTIQARGGVSLDIGTIVTVPTRLVGRTFAQASRLSEAQGADVVAANNLALGTDGNVFEVTGNTQINLIDNTNWIAGSEITLHILGTPTIKNNQATVGANTKIILDGNADLVVAAPTMLKLVLTLSGAVTAWRQCSKATAVN